MSNIVKNNNDFGFTGTGAKDETGNAHKAKSINVLNRDTRPMIDESGSNDGLLKFVKANGLGLGAGRVTQSEKYTKFARYERLDPQNWMGMTREYVFFTKPDLQIFNGNVLNSSIANNTLFREAYDRYHSVLESLSWSVNTHNPFVNLLSNYKIFLISPLLTIMRLLKIY